MIRESRYRSVSHWAELSDVSLDREEGGLIDGAVEWAPSRRLYAFSRPGAILPPLSVMADVSAGDAENIRRKTHGESSREVAGCCSSIPLAAKHCAGGCTDETIAEHRYLA